MAETNYGLMKQTKVQLVDIILRKDAVEKELRKEQESLNCKVNALLKEKEDADAEIFNLSKNLTRKSEDFTKLENAIKADSITISRLKNELAKRNEQIDSYESGCDEMVVELTKYKNKAYNYKVGFYTVSCIAVALVAITLCNIIF